ncbi:MAG: hypothetical protein HFJ55_01075 [Clostridia bacterium]|jgi:hypothetical protein|nr:hypothetical protein [Clostridia bacterium]
MSYITDGNIEVVYNKETGVAITVMVVKEKFLPITKYIKPEILKQVRNKKQNALSLDNSSTINSKAIINNKDYSKEETITFYELYTSLVVEILNYTSNFKHHSAETVLKSEQPYNIVYRKEVTKTPMTASELFGIGKKEENKKMVFKQIV